jgi:hypothetical protein
MCDFFSFGTDGKTNRYYFKNDRRKELLKSNPTGLNPDSHASIAVEFGIREDKMNKYEYNPLTYMFKVDQINCKDDHVLAEKWVRKLDFKTVVPELIIKPIINPFSIDPPEISEIHIELLRKWDSVRVSVRDSVWASVRASVRASVWVSVRDSVWASVRDSVKASVRDSVRVSVRVWDSVWASAWDSALAYISSFFTLQEWKYTDAKNGINPFQSCIDLWEMGIVPSFDGNIWRLHTKNGIAFEISKENLLTKKP